MSKLMNVKIWLIVLAFMHTLMGVIINYQQNGNIENLSNFMVLGCISVYLLYAAFFVSGHNQAKLAIVICLPFLLLFIVSGVMKLNMFGVPVAEMPQGLLPLFLWVMPIICSLKSKK